MSASYTLYSNLIKEAEIPVNGILSRTLHSDSGVKVILFAFAAGQELSAHTAQVPAEILILEGEAELTLGTERSAAGPGTWVHMPARLEHGILARTPVRMLLTMIKCHT
jgi:quercetin dioxygenase-like cupin family protein